MAMAAQGTTAGKRVVLVITGLVVVGLVMAGSVLAFFLTRDSAPFSLRPAKELSTVAVPSNAVQRTAPNFQSGTYGGRNARTQSADVQRGQPPQEVLSESDLPPPLPHINAESQPLPTFVSSGTSRTVRTHHAPQGPVSATGDVEGPVRTFRPPPQDTSFVRDAMHALHPLFEECDSLTRATESSAEFEGLLIVEFVVDVVDDSNERIVRDVSIREGSDALPPLLQECVVETVYTLALPPSEGRPVRVTYPLHFSHHGTGYQVRGMGPSPAQGDAPHAP